jgi:hypothetical protein
MKWITRAQVKVDRVACPWLIRKFVDQDAEFYFVPADKVMEEAKRPGATPFDVTNVELGHHGEDVSFNSILKKYGLADPALQLLGEIVRTADSHPTNPHPAGERRRATPDRARPQYAGIKRSGNPSARVYRLRRALCRVPTARDSLSTPSEDELYKPVFQRRDSRQVGWEENNKQVQHDLETVS